jgi:multicomponent Na+:H+ antiporter subunit A
VIAIVLLHLIIAALAPAAARRLGPRIFWLCAVAPAAALVWVVTSAGPVLDRRPRVEHVGWVPGLNLGIDLRLDGFSLLMAGLISGVGILIFVYSRWYFSDQPGLGRFAGTLTAFAGAMLGVVLADNLFVLYVFWELTSITSYLLIGFEDKKGAARAAALQALLITAAGGLAMLGGFVMLGQAAGTYSLSGIVADPPSGALVAPALVLVLLGAFTKSAQAPFHSWLPGAMAAPTPVSAYLHSATMVKAGVYLIARLAPAFAGSVALWRPLVMGVGLATMLLGGYRALRQHDLKLVLAYGTVSQLGLMVVLVGAGRPDLTFAGAALLLAHSLFKAALFLVVGIIDHQAHTRDLRSLSGLGRRMPATFAVAAVAAASMAGLPPLLGFVSKEAVYEGLLHAGSGIGDGAVLVGVVLGSALTLAYGARFLWGGFATKAATSAPGSVGADVGAPSWPFLAPAAVLAVLTVACGVLPVLAAGVVEAAAGDLDPASRGLHLALWHGVNTALVLSALTVGSGALLFAGRARIERLQDRMPALPSAFGAYEALVVGLNRVARASTGIVQNGSLPIYIAVILMTVLALPAVALLQVSGVGYDVRLADSPLQVAVAAVVIAAAVGATFAGRRFAAVLFVGGVGYGVAVLFMVQGAPDLALTQFLVETLTLVVFVLVLRHLPERFEPGPRRLGEGARWVIAGGMGVFVAGFVVVAASARTAAPVSDEHIARALPDGGGRNVVNVILTDFRGLDTLGEVTVLSVAGLGIASLVAAGRRTRKASPAAEAAPRVAPSLILERCVSGLFHTALLYSLFLLLAGHNAPGGGFVGGLVAGAAFVLRFVHGGTEEVRRTTPLSWAGMVGAGLVVTGTTGAAAWIRGAEFLTSGKLALDLPLLGTVKTTSALAFDVGVYLVVVGLVLGILLALGQEEDAEHTALGAVQP